jgi:hypothetical protein
MENFMKYLPLLVPIFLVELVLMAIAILDLVRRQKTHGPKWVWALVIFLVQMIGPIVYLVMGREEE